MAMLGHSRASRRRRRGPPLMVLLLGLAALPLAFFTWFLRVGSGDVREARSAAADVHRLAGEIDELTELRLALLHENRWSMVVIRARELGLPIEVVLAATSFDVLHHHETSLTATDRALRRGAATAYADDVEWMRSIYDAPDHRDISARYEVIAAELDQRIEDQRVGIEDRAGHLPDGARVAHASRMAESASAARWAHVHRLWSYLNAEFSSDEESASSYIDVAFSDERVAEEFARIDAKSGPESALPAELKRLRASEDHVVFDSAVSQRPVAYGVLDDGSRLRLADACDD